MGLIGVMQTADGLWRVEVGGVGSVTWYWLIGIDSAQDLPDLTALAEAFNEVGIDVGDLHEVDAAT